MRQVPYDFTDPDRVLRGVPTPRSLDTEALLARQDRRDDACKRKWRRKVVLGFCALCAAYFAVLYVNHQGARAAENVRLNAALASYERGQR